MVKKILLGALALVAVAVAGLLAVAATKPDTFRVERSAAIHAKPEAIYALIEDYHQWAQWSPFEKMDPAMKKTFSGAPKGQGAVYAWSGNDHAGSGSMTMTRAVAPEAIQLALDFDRPMPAHNTVEFKLVPQGDVTTVTWSMEGPTPYPAKVMHCLFDMDKMLGGDFEKGLAGIKTIAEAEAKHLKAEAEKKAVEEKAAAPAPVADKK